MRNLIILFQLITICLNAQPSKTNRLNYYKTNIENNINKLEVFIIINQFKHELKDTLLVDSIKNLSKQGFKNHKEALWLNALCYLKKAELSKFSDNMCYYDNALKPIWKLLDYPNDTSFPLNSDVEKKRLEIQYLIQKECTLYFNSIGNKPANIDQKICLCNSIIHDMIEEEKDRASEESARKKNELIKDAKLLREKYIKDSIIKNTPFSYKEIVYKRNGKLIADSLKLVKCNYVDSLNLTLESIMLSAMQATFIRSNEGKSYTEKLIMMLDRSYNQPYKVYKRTLEFKKQNGKLVLINFEINEFNSFFNFVLSQLNTNELKLKIKEGSSLHLPFSLTVNSDINVTNYTFDFINGYLQTTLPFPATKTNTIIKSLTRLKAQKEIYHVHDTVKLRLYNPEGRVFQDCENGVFHTLEKLNGDTWEAYYGCCMCNLDKPPHYLNDSVIIIKTYPHVVGVYRVKVNNVGNGKGILDIHSLDNNNSKPLESLTFYSDTFYVVPKKEKTIIFYENEKNMNASLNNVINYYENSKLIKDKAILYDNIYVVSKCNLNNDWYKQLIKYYGILPVYADTCIKIIYKKNNIKKAQVSSHFSDDNKCNQVFILSNELKQEIGKHIEIRGNLIKLNGNDAILSNRVNVTLKKDVKYLDHTFLTWIHTKKYKMYSANGESDWTNVTQFQIHFETINPDEILKLTTELVNSPYFIKVSNVFDFPPVYTPKD